MLTPEVYLGLCWGDETLPETSIAPENRASQKETSIPSQPSFFRCYVSCREGTHVSRFVYITLTPPKFNMEPENRPLEKEKHLPNHHFWGSMLVFGGGKRFFSHLFQKVFIFSYFFQMCTFISCHNHWQSSLKLIPSAAPLSCGKCRGFIHVIHSTFHAILPWIHVFM